MLIHPRYGSYFFIGEVLTTLELPPKPTLKSMPGCGSCTRCIDACPTSAFPEPMVLDARRCISYLTIEHKGIIDRALRSLMKNWVFGCDICQQVCPWQRFAATGDIELKKLIDTFAPVLSTLLLLTDKVFEEMYSGTPIARIGRDRMVRNACIAAGNSRQLDLLEHLTPLLQDHSTLVRVHAAWAVGRLGGLDQLRVSLEHEDDPDVRSEIEYALATEES
jgi:epoxyqueuosine reductase